ncbi:hypothetical protein ACTJK3_01285 [Pseudomonas sp. 22105]|jgi:hypothetical protein|uniref:Lipoprotein n=1 Tax=Pseudomonas glycinae TaxID=1785145 RepID=A0ABM5ZKR2_9PSED|nr:MULTISPECIES: hypothetical protein [Pseudomonas]AMQ83076.1 hypothetical protein AWU82_07105 [Pseudomonas glycinae]AWA42218.1 hypothetical protein DBV33_27735 [Pseudomonas fluorescens]NKF25469.1 hypothetical protein [Pseudomonas sp. BG5]
MRALFKSGFLISFCLYSVASFACDVPESQAYHSISTKDGAIVFDLVPIEGEASSDGSNSQMGIDVNYIDCASRAKTLVGQLPYLADTGQVRAAFFADVKGGSESELFVIHSVGIHSDTGVKYSGEYYSVHVYKKSDDGYSRDERISKYFGEGGDILTDDYKGFLYVFPYKDQLSVSNKLATTAFSKWNDGIPVQLTINKKAKIYSSPVFDDVTRMYLIAGDKVQQEAVEAGWLSVMFKTPKGKEIRGWILCGDADGC